MWTLVELQLFRVGPLCGTLWHLNVEPLCGPLWNVNFSEWDLYVEPGGTSTFNSGGARFRAAAPNHPEALLEEPQTFQAVGEKIPKNWPWV